MVLVEVERGARGSGEAWREKAAMRGRCKIHRVPRQMGGLTGRPEGRFVFER